MFVGVLYSEYFLVTKPRSFNFINCRTLLNTNECLQLFLCARVGELLDFMSSEYFNFKSSIAIGPTPYGASRDTSFELNFMRRFACTRVIVLAANFLRQLSNVR